MQSRLSTLESTHADLTAQLLSTQSQLSVAQTQLARHDEEGAKREERGKAEVQAEVGTLKQKLATYADYDEIKRELEIMKVSWCTLHNEFSTRLLMPSNSTLNLAVSTMTLPTQMATTGPPTSRKVYISLIQTLTRRMHSMERVSKYCSRARTSASSKSSRVSG